MDTRCNMSGLPIQATTNAIFADKLYLTFYPKWDPTNTCGSFVYTFTSKKFETKARTRELCKYKWSCEMSLTSSYDVERNFSCLKGCLTRRKMANWNKAYTKMRHGKRKRVCQKKVFVQQLHYLNAATMQQEHVNCAGVHKLVHIYFSVWRICHGV